MTPVIESSPVGASSAEDDGVGFGDKSARLEQVCLLGSWCAALLAVPGGRTFLGEDDCRACAVTVTQLGVVADLDAGHVRDRVAELVVVGLCYRRHDEQHSCDP